MFKDDKARNRAWIVFVFLSGVILFLVGLALLAPSQVVVADDPETTETEETEVTPEILTSEPTEPITTTETVTDTPSLEPTTETPPEPTAETPSPEPTTETPPEPTTETPPEPTTETPPEPTTETPSPVPVINTLTSEPPTSAPAPTEAVPTATPTSTPGFWGRIGGTRGLIIGGVLAATAAVAVILLLVLRVRKAPGRQPPTPIETPEPVPGAVELAQPSPEPVEGLQLAGASPLQSRPYLQSTSNPQLQLPLEHDTVSIGRAMDNDLVIDQWYQGSETLSNHHARFEWDEQRRRWLVVDENSRNGVFVNGQRTGENVLQGGELIRFGSVEFGFHVPELGG